MEGVPVPETRARHAAQPHPGSSAVTSSYQAPVSSAASTEVTPITQGGAPVNPRLASTTATTTTTAVPATGVANGITAPIGGIAVGGVTDNASIAATEGGPPSSSTRNFATSRKVQKLLDITVNDNFRELVLYMNDAVPEFLESLLPPPDDSSISEVEKTSTQQRQQSQPLQHTGIAVASSSTTLRTALEGRVIDLHRYFLQEWSTLNEVFEEASDFVSKLNEESGVLQTALDAHAAQAEEYVGLMTTLQAELSLVQQREKEMREFQEKYHFAAEEQAILEESPVDSAYLDVLQRAQVTHRKCRELLLSREHYQSAAAVMDITYSAIMKGSEKVARYLMSASAAAPGSTANAAGFGGSDAPELTSFYLRCVQFLREENISQWAAVIEEVARLRRAAVLRQYFHLMTTGSSTTLAGTYRAGGRRDRAPSTGGVRALEAEISNPVFFFSSLFAWLHQVIVDEDDFFTAFFAPPALVADDATTALSTDKETASVRDGEPGALAVPSMVGEDALDGNGETAFPVSKAAVLDSIFEVLCKHIQSVLDGVLERFLRASSSLHDGDNSSSGGGAGGSGSGAGASTGPSGPIGLTGGIKRLLTAATGRTVSLTSDAGEGAQRYQHLMNRSQQEALVASTLMGLTNGLRTAHTLLQLFTYYNCSTFTALLGSEAALTRLVANDSKLQLLRVYHTIAKQLAEHALDSVAGVASRSAVLRRLASAEAMLAVEDGTKKSDRATYFVTDFLFDHAAEEDKENDSAPLHDDMQRQVSPQLSSERETPSNVRGQSLSISSTTTNPYHRSGLSKHQAQAADLLRTLYTMILPTPPEVEECLRVLQSTMVEAEKHAEIMESVRLMLSKKSANEENIAANHPLYYEQFFTVPVQHVLSFPIVLARQPTISNALDEPCKLTLQLNTMAALQETLAPHLNLLALGNAAAGHTTPLSDVVSERIQKLANELIASLSKCAVRHYFHQRLRSAMATPVSGGDDVGRISNMGGGMGRGDADADGEQLDAATIIAQLSGFYSVVAASGHVYVPLVAALRLPRLREQVMRGVVRELCDVYETRYTRLLELGQQQLPSVDADFSEASLTVSDLDPRKLRILLDEAPSLPS
ncbi:putative conserved oligomeric Golgi complex subunit 6-like isoform X1 [Trypanosoma grayi]|uniref:putative conserved oligomeric Golgi complex subunit 6-like isoform X1 n=1 Tax=Trypanosoma grayi TaxID=71804 RepID=UPI0004F445E2|nr:putative conserved oligomeric Golgi complex subunit 6-like isoform X1 [Trypanosoma grayi]KEG15661.1 putative conserved oligomeric Golgi complex subunit 6-like isoform X1 [Trypanosoma grayi]